MWNSKMSIHDHRPLIYLVMVMREFGARSEKKIPKIMHLLDWLYDSIYIYTFWLYDV